MSGISLNESSQTASAFGYSLTPPQYAGGLSVTANVLQFLFFLSLATIFFFSGSVTDLRGLAFSFHW